LTSADTVQDDLDFDPSETKEFDECTAPGVSGCGAQHSGTFVPVLLRTCNAAPLTSKIE
jgi:hypothetical protein